MIYIHTDKTDTCLLIRKYISIYSISYIYIHTDSMGSLFCKIRKLDNGYILDIYIVYIQLHRDRQTLF